ncbi:MAG: phosphomethylpyrimidine synthase ThiC [Thermoanaerobaculia bacterium]
MTILDILKKGKTPDFFKKISQEEDIPVKKIKEEVLQGRAVVCFNPQHKNLKPIAIGSLFSTKVNVNIGISPLVSDFEKEKEKVKLALKLKTDTIMDLSVGKDASNFRKWLIENAPCPVGTVPIYQVANKFKDIEEADFKDFLEEIERQAKEGVDFMTIHAGFLKRHIPLVQKRKLGIVSRGGALLYCWMARRGEENPFYKNFDELLDILNKYDVTISIGDALRPGSLMDASDEAQFAELKTIGKLLKKCKERNVQAMVEGPGHIPLNQIEMNIKRALRICKGAPFYVLGPVVCDIAGGYDHITSAIGATLAGYYGASLLCYVTPKEHLGLPNLEDVRQGLVAFKIAALSSDIAKGKKYALKLQEEMAYARKNFLWEKQFSLMLDPERARQYFKEGVKEEGEYCSMCGPDFCPMKITK